MKLKLFVISLLALFYLGLFQAFASSTSSIIVKSNAGNVITNGSLILSPQDAPMERKVFKPNQKGAFEVPSQSFGGEVYWSYQHEDFENIGGAHLVLEDYSKENPYEIVLSKSGNFRVKVVDKSGKPVKDAFVRLDRDVPAGDHTHVYEKLDHKVTNESGLATFKNIGLGNVMLFASKPGWISEGTTTLYNDHKSEFSLTVVPSKHVDLFITDHQGKPLNDINFKWTVSNEYLAEEKVEDQKINGTIHTGNTQPFRLELPQSKYLHLKVTSEHVKRLELFNEVLHTMDNLHLTLDFNPKVFGVVKEKGSNVELEEVDLTLTKRTSRYDYINDTYSESEEKGYYAIYGGKAGTYDLTAQKQGLLPLVIKGLELKINKEKKVDLELEQGKTTQFRFLTKEKDKTVPLPSRHLNYNLWNARYDVEQDYEGESNEKGIYKLSGWEDGDEVIFQVKDYSPITIPLEHENKIHDIILTKAGIADIIVKDEKGNLIKESSFYPSYEDDNSFYDENIWYNVQYDQNVKAYRVSGLSPKTYGFSVEADGYFSAVENKIKIQSGKTITKEIILKKAKPLQLRLKALDGVLKDQAWITFQDQNQYYSDRGEAIKDDSDNLYKVNLADENAVFLVVQMEGFKPSKRLRVERDKEDHIYQVTLQKGLVFAGKVVDEEQNSVPKAKLNLRTEDYDFQTDETESDENGLFKVDGLPQGHIIVEVDADGYAAFEQSYSITKDEYHQIITLSRGGSVKGFVVSPDNKRVGDVVLTMLENNGFDYGEIYDGGFMPVEGSKPDGTFLFKNIPNGQYKIDANAESMIGESKSFTIDGSTQIEDLEIRLKEALELSGKVIDEEDNPVPDLELYCYNYLGGRDNDEVKTDAKGHFKISSLKAGSYSIELSGNEYELAEGGRYGETSFTAGKKDIVLKVRKPKLIHCKIIVPNDQRLKGFSVFMRDEELTEDPLDVDGINNHEFSVSSAAVNDLFYGEKFQIVVKAMGYNPGESSYFSSTDEIEDVIEIKLKPEKSIDLRITDSYGQPLSGVSIQYHLYNQYNHYSFYDEKIYYSNDQGELNLKGIASGRYDFRVEKEGHAISVKTLDINVDSGDVVDIVMGKGGTIEGQVLDSSGAGKKFVTVALVENSSQSFEEIIKTKTDEFGNFKLLNAPVGIFKIKYYDKQEESSFYFEEKGWPIVDIEEGSHQTINLGGEVTGDKGTIVGRIVDQEITYMAAILLTLNGDTPTHQTVISNGEFEMQSVEPGEYMVMIVNAEGQFLKRNIEVKAQETVEVEFGKADMSIKGLVEHEEGISLERSQVYLVRGDYSLDTEQDSMEAFESMGVVQNGTFKLEVTQPGTYLLIFNNFEGLSNQWSGYQEESVQITVGEHLDVGKIIIKKGNTISGTITTEDGSPIKNAYIDVMRGFSPMYNDSWVSDAKGWIELDGMPEFPITLIVNHDLYVSKTVEITSDDFRIELQKAGKIQVKLVGRRIKNRQIELHNLDDKKEEGSDLSTYDEFGFPYETNHMGEVTITGLVKGNYRLKVLPVLKNESAIESNEINLDLGQSIDINFELND